MAEGSGKVQHIVADSAAFLRNAPLHDMCENVYTIEDVINEIRDVTTRQRLAVLPYNIQFREPSTEALHAVSEFAKLTGDFRSLSAVDLRVLALTYQLEKEHCGTDHIKTRPTKQVEITQGFTGKTVPGFFVEKKPKDESGMKEDETASSNAESGRTDDKQMLTNTDQQQSNMLNTSDMIEQNIVDLSRTEISSNARNDENDESSTGEITTAMETLTTNNSTLNDSRDNDEGFEESENVDNDDDDLDSNDDDDDDGWITPDNISRVKGQIGKGTLHAVPANVTVGCLTTDFAMQVARKCRIHRNYIEVKCVDPDGIPCDFSGWYVDQEARSYVLKCYACFRVTSQIDKKFCPSCGNNTLVKVSASVDENGVTHYQVPNRKKPFNIRGKKFPLPLP
ncbi:Nin1 binding protein [Desmophyllum pertusum]|uniref:RNA-binding protein NOB1 n=1 Tax=Desmophyllum pertusum TaxID=174260 RepID=A0A9X0D1R9_9CNID|nr:Nin1 binding protein [Desmophyllum pertusum]